MNRIRTFVQLGMVLLWALGLRWTASAQSWVLVWSDEFTQPDGSAPASANWSYDLGGAGWGNNELETYTSRTNNSRIVGGQLVIEARQENYTGTDGIPRNFTSARLKTKGKWAWTRGRIEARIQVPRGQGIWPAFWTLGANVDSSGWPDCGEIDIMENIGAEPGTVHGTIHGPGYSGGDGIGGPYTLPGGAALADAFHLFAVEWETNAIRWFMDGQLYFTATTASLPAGTQWVFNAPQFLLLNVAVGGNWPGNPDGSTTFPQRMLVDYVRVYARTNSAGTGANLLNNPGFELSGLTGWTRYGANTYLENIANVPVHGGSNVFKVFGQFSGVDNFSGIYQDLASVPGSAYTADGWAFTQSGDRIAGSNAAWIEVSFRDGSGNVLALYRSGIFDSATPAGVWRNLSVTNQHDPATLALIGTTTNLTAPTGTTSIRYQVVFRQPANAGGAVLFDDFYLSQLSGASPPVISNISPDGAVPYVMATNQIRFTARSSGAAINPGGIQVLLNDVDISPLLSIAGPVTNRTVSFSGLATNRVYSVWARAADTNGLFTTAAWQFDTFSQGNFMWEAEDYDFNGGQFIDNPVPSSTARTNSYFGRVAVQKIDVNETSLDGSHLYRPADLVSTSVPTDFVRQKYLDAISGGDTNARDYQLGYFYGGEWLNYTRTFPAGNYYVYGRLAGGLGATELFLDRVVAGQGTTNQTTMRLGSFKFTGEGWQSFDFVQLSNSNGIPVTVSLAGVVTLRATSTGGADPNHFMLVPTLLPVRATAAKSGSNVVLSFLSQVGLTYLVLFKNSLGAGTWQMLASVIGDGTTKSVLDPITGSSRFYQVVAQ